MKKILLIFLLVLYAQPALAAITSIATLGTGNSVTSNNTLAMTTSATLEAANMGLCAISLDNTGTGDGTTSEISSVVDSAGNTWSYVHSYRNGQGSAAAGHQIELWMVKATTQLTSGGTITVTFANTITSKAISCREFTVASGKTLGISAGTNPVNEAADAIGAGSIATAGLSNISHLQIRLVGVETNGGVTITVTAGGWASWGQSIADAGAGSTSSKVMGEFFIVTSTGQTSAPTTNSSDNANFIIALEEIDVPVSRPPVAPFIFQ